jgi:hypothetical protein
MLKQILLAAVVATPLNLAAKDMNGNFATYGLGARSCGDYIEARKQGDELLDYYNNFVVGYLSAINLVVPNTFDILGTRTMGEAFEWLDLHCGKSPSENFTNAMALLTGAFYDERKNFQKSKQGWLGTSDSAKDATSHIYK